MIAGLFGILVVIGVPVVALVIVIIRATRRA